ncbi:acid phosphatase/Vanadium-dependent haloperoxidase [Conidiobolus coronatus NRRL 28638]|uniref:Acid phosphatase/Vanadium-dependent haloperoxidase n=1 Tax=Conidiobolus coronatus (strain ATCC 28846 / CBS 209.66 / NRRL 28638) TaxID=796925 RepID=A0A137PBY5_CONC2|nr:acid phosphatase/Vanadium-dependent haloperoxidase [Conidiobolus coronatus NRRL 28638]|eukprot:KXN72482.1 acid phosphatase/Vanadium-dependent haloperoxidase [Conidiobolus coronatus NRRL 28638]
MDRLKTLFKSDLALLLVDWLTCISLFALIKIFDVLVPPFKREFSLADTTIQYTLTEKEMVPNWLLWVLGLVLPAVIILVSYLKVKNLEKVHLGLIGELIKQSEKLYSLFTSAICTQQDSKILRGGMQSFPSGHTSTSFSGLGFLSYYLNHILQLSHKRTSLIQYYAVLVPLLIATFVAVSRLRDYRHHWQDVLVGAIIGMLSAYFSYKKYFKKRVNYDKNLQLIQSNEDNALNNFSNVNSNNNRRSPSLEF